ncbi:TetR family transcriptional regulator [Thermodesulfobacteriota bacterium]
MTKKKSNTLNTYRPKISKDIIPSSAKDLKLIEKKQKQIVEAACSLFFKKGFHGTSIREIANEGKMSMGQLYHYISSKDDILFLVAKHMQELWYENLVEFGFEETEEPLARLTRAIRSSIEFPAKHKKLLQFIYTESKYLGKEHLNIILKMDNKNVSGFFQKLLEEVNKKYPIEDDLALVAKYITFVTVFIALRGWNLKKWSLEESVDFQVRFILKGLGLPYNENL